jgi:succinate-semialdehyde dehydrogenase/glutarate-semialdehyde dehydrogenase
MLTRKAGPALAAGCSMVVKPATQTPYSALAFALLAERAGVPKGLLSVLTGSASKIGGEMTRNPLVRKLSFTGSTEVGRLLMRQSADTIKKLSLELGGNAPFIVFDDADLDAAVDGAMISKYRNTGQTCVCANRIYVQQGVLQAFTDKLVAKVNGLKVGSGVDAGVTQGPLIDAKAVAKIEEHVADAVAKGGKVLTGGKRHKLGGLFFEPTVVAGATADMLFASEETFGPLAPIFAFDTESEVIDRANDTEFGLAAYFYSRDIGRVMRVAERLESGMVGVNTGLISTAEAPFGGVKQSGLGREGSKYGLDEFLEVKYICLAGLDK